eukprot:1154843-Pelagomonas_calceolata.AAC.1
MANSVGSASYLSGIWELQPKTLVAVRHSTNTPLLPSTPLVHIEKKREVYAGHRPRALRKGPLTSKLARASPEVPQRKRDWHLHGTEHSSPCPF